MKTFLTILWIITLVVVSFGNIVVVAPDFDKEAIGFSITPSEREEFRSLLEVWMNEAIKHQSVSVIHNAETPQNSGQILRITQNTYATRPDIMSQYVGILDLTYSLFEKGSMAPFYTISYQVEGERFWGENKPYLHALEESVKEFRKKYKKFLKSQSKK